MPVYYFVESTNPKRT